MAALDQMSTAASENTRGYDSAAGGANLRSVEGQAAPVKAPGNDRPSRESEAVSRILDGFALSGGDSAGTTKGATDKTPTSKASGEAAAKITTSQAGDEAPAKTGNT